MGSQATTTEGEYGPGSFVDTSFTPVPKECTRLLHYLAKNTPGFTQDAAVLDAVKFEGLDYPCIPGPIKSQAMTAVLHAMAGIVGQEILELKGQSSAGPITINTDQAGLYLGTIPLFSVDGKDSLELNASGEIKKIMPSSNLGDALGNTIMYRIQAIYPTKTPGVWYDWHGSTNPLPMCKAFGIDPSKAPKTNDEAYEVISAVSQQYSYREIEMIMMDHGLCGSPCYSPAAWRETLTGKALARHSLIQYNVQKQCPSTPPVPFPTSADKRPLAGIKVVEIARIIAAPACGAALAAMGADVVRITSKSLVDLDLAQFSLTAGKVEAELDLTTEEHRAQLMKLLEQADVIINGFRRKSIERKGFGLNALLEMANKRNKGIIYVDENCYGPDGYYAERPGWQQIADAAAGSSYVIGNAYGFKDGKAVLPSLPISDMSTGATGCVTTMLALRDRAKYGGSYHCEVALTKYNTTTLEPEVGLYTRDVVAKLQSIYDWPAMTPDLHVIELFYMMVAQWKKKSKFFEQEALWVDFNNSPYGKSLKILAPMVRYADPEATPKWVDPPVPFCFHKELAFRTPPMDDAWQAHKQWAAGVVSKVAGLLNERPALQSLMKQ
ncbi:hypothetical protein MMC18_007152 [Xylographa bjoerkii]|nr:hypothetical protein [Xylographa bjoerkii]